MAELLDPRDHKRAVELALMIKTLKDKRRALRSIGEKELAEKYYEAEHS